MPQNEAVATQAYALMLLCKIRAVLLMFRYIMAAVGFSPWRAYRSTR